MKNVFKNVGRRFRRSLRAISPVIAVLLMIVIAVAASLVAYAWVMGYLGFTTAKVGKAIQIQSIARSDANNVTIWVQNVGDSDVVVSDVYVNDVLNTPVTSLPITLPATETEMIELGGTHGGLQVKIKVVNSDGSFIEYTKTFTSTSGGGGMAPPTYMYYREISFTGVVGSHSGRFPVLITLSAADISANFPTSEDQFWFTDNAGTPFPHEVESFSAGNSLTAWVGVDSLTSSSTIRIYYGATRPSYNPTAVWSNGYEAVYHLHDDFLDSTSNIHHGTNQGSTDTTGKIGDAQLFVAASAQYIDVGTWSVSGDELTIQAWIKSEDNWDQDDARVISKSIGGSDQQHVWMMSTNDRSGGPGTQDENRLRFRLKTGTSDTSGTTTQYGTSPNGYLTDGNAWYLAAMTYDGTNMRIIRDGLDAGSTAKTGNLRENGWTITIGTNTGQLSPWDGKIDEVRISSAARSINWMRTEYNNQNNPSAFINLGSEMQESA